MKPGEVKQARIYVEYVIAKAERRVRGGDTLAWPDAYRALAVQVLPQLRAAKIEPAIEGGTDEEECRRILVALKRREVGR